jgi:hypothetical protein
VRVGANFWDGRQAKREKRQAGKERELNKQHIYYP